MYEPLALLLLQLPRLWNTCLVLLRIPHGKHPNLPLLVGYWVLMETLKSPNSFNSPTSNLPFVQWFIKVITIVMKPLLF